MSPEAYTMKYTFASDIWSFGLIAYEVVVEQPPWKNLQVKSADFLIKQSPFCDGWEKIVNNEELVNLIKNCTIPDASKRINTKHAKIVLRNLCWK